MVVCAAAPDHPPCRVLFLEGPWHPNHPDFLVVDRSLAVDHVARLLREACQQLDLTPLLRSYSGRGSQPYPPALLVPFVLFMLFQGYASPTQWARQAARNDEAKWLLAGLRPAHTQLYVLARRLAPFLDAWFSQVVRWAIQLGLTTAQRASIDGTFLACQASRHRLLRYSVLQDRRDWLLARTLLDAFRADPAATAAWEQLLRHLLLSASPEQMLLGLLLGLLLGIGSQTTPAWMAQTPAGRRLQLQRYDLASERLTTQQQGHAKRQARRAKLRRQLASELKICVSDPEAALGLDKEKVFRPLYNVQLAQATDAPLTLAFEVLASCTDQGQLLPMVQRTEETTGRHLEEALVDEGYINLIHLKECEQRRTVVYAPADSLLVAQRRRRPPRHRLRPAGRRPGRSRPSSIPRPRSVGTSRSRRTIARRANGWKSAVGRPRRGKEASNCR